MMASLTTLMTAMALTATAPSSPTWESDYGKALAQTRSDSRPLLIVMDKPGVEKQQVSEKLLSNAAPDAPLAKYDLCHVDVSTEYGRSVAKAFKASQFPYFAIIDKSGSVILHRHAGEVTEASWKAALTRHQLGERARRVTVAKPVTSETTAVSTFAEPAVHGGYHETSTPSYYSKPVNSYCPNCQRR